MTQGFNLQPVNNIENILVSGDTLDYRNKKLLICSSRSREAFKIFDINNMKVLHQVRSDISQAGSEFHCYSARFAPTKGDYTVFAGSSAPNSLRIFEKLKNDYRSVKYEYNVQYPD